MNESIGKLILRVALGGMVIMHGIAKLTDEKVVAIRSEYAQGGTTHAELAIKYGIGRRTIGNVINRKLWKHVP